MTADPLVPILPWTALREEKRRFQLSISWALAIFVVAGGLVPFVSLPPLELPPKPVLSKRVVRLIEEQRLGPTAELTDTAPRSGPELQARAEPESDSGFGAETRPKPKPKPEPAPVQGPEPMAKAESTTEPETVDSRAVARQKARRSGVLAFADSLVELREAVPEAINTERDSALTSSGAEASRSKRAIRTAEVSSISAGIDVAGLSRQGTFGVKELNARRNAGSLVPSEAKGVTGREGRETQGVRKFVRSEEEIQEILDRNKSTIYTIYNRELRKDPTLQGKVVVSITIAPSGEVTVCRILSSELNAPALERKLVLLLKRIDFGAKPDVTEVTTRVPIDFFPA